MKRMPNIKLTRKEYDQIAKNQRFDKGCEGIICQGFRDDTLYKIFVEYDTIEPIQLPDNKHKKILSLYERNIDHTVQPVSTISLDGQLIGYEITHDKDDINLDTISLSRKLMIQSLKESRNILRYFDSQDITFVDVKGSNILVNRKNHQVTFCDIDNMRVGQYPVDLLNDYVDSFIETESDIDGKVDAYMHNLLTIQKLQKPKLDYNKIICNIEAGKYKGLSEKDVASIIDGMDSYSNFTGEYIIEYIKR